MLSFEGRCSLCSECTEGNANGGHPACYGCRGDGRCGRSIMGTMGSCRGAYGSSKSISGSRSISDSRSPIPNPSPIPDLRSQTQPVPSAAVGTDSTTPSMSAGGTAMPGMTASGTSMACPQIKFAAKPGGGRLPTEYASALRQVVGTERRELGRIREQDQPSSSSMDPSVELASVHPSACGRDLSYTKMLTDRRQKDVLG